MTTVLIIDDDTNIRKFAAANLKARGYTVYEAENGEVGLQKVQQVNPSAILLDLKMPHVNGWQVLEALSNQPNLKEIPVIILTASIQDAEGKMDLYGNVWEVLQKPIGLKELISTITSVIEAK